MSNLRCAAESADSANPSVYGETITFNATVTAQGSGTPSGSVTFKDGLTALGTAPLIGATATLNTSTLGVGTHSITAWYSGDSNFLHSVSPTIVQTVDQASTTTSLVSSANPGYRNQTITLTATVKSLNGGAASGNVTFKQGTLTVATVPLASEQATYSTSYTTTGTRSITAAYSGDAK